MNTEILRPTLNSANICVHGVKQAKKDNSYPLHFHSECEMYLCIHGQMTFVVNNEAFVLSDGDIVFVNESTPHETQIKKDTVGFLIQFSLDNNLNDINKYLRRYSISRGENCALLRCGCAENTQIRTCLEEIIRENEEKAPAFDKYVKAAVQKIIAILYRAGILKDADDFLNSKDAMRLLPVIEYINSHFGEEISLEDMSRLLNVDKAHFCRLFKKAMNTTLIKYLNFVRVYKAEKMLFETDKTISQIAEDVGFSSASYFTEIFRKHRYCSPLIYRKMKGM